MKKLALLFFLVGIPAAAQQFPVVQDHSIIGRIGTGSGSGPSSAIPFSLFLPTIVGTQAKNTVFSGPSSGVNAQPSFRALVTSDIPNVLAGGSSANSSFTLESTTSGSPSGDIANLVGSTVNVGGYIGAASTVNIGSGSGGVTLNIASATNGLTALNVYNVSGGKQTWIPGGGNTTVTFPTATDQLIARATTDTLTNKTYDTAGTGNVFKINGIQVTTPAQIGAALCLPQRSVFTSGTNATYSVPTCNGALPSRIDWEIVGGGGGGAGSGTSPTTATGGGNSCVNSSGTACSTPLFSANGGSAGTANNTPTSGGSASSCDINLTGATGGQGSGLANSFGGIGGNSFFGGAGPPGNSSTIAGNAAAANSGSGGGGAGETSTSSAGGGGGAGGYCRKMLTSPASSYVYTVGTAGGAGGAGTGGGAGGAGAAGLIMATAFWQ